MERLTLAGAFVLTVIVGCADTDGEALSPPPPCDGGTCTAEATPTAACPTFGGELVRADLPPDVHTIVVAGEWLFAALQLDANGTSDVLGARLDGTGTPRVVTSIPFVEVSNTRAMAASGGYLYVRDTQRLQRVRLPLADPPEIVAVASGITHIYDATPTHLFVGSADRLVRMNGATSEVEPFDLDDAPMLGNIGLSSSHAFWRHVTALEGGVAPGAVPAANGEIVSALIDGGRASASGVTPDIRTASGLGASGTSIFYFSVEGELYGQNLATKSAPVVVRPSTGVLRGAWGGDGFYYFTRRREPSSECWGLWRVDLSAAHPEDEWLGDVGSRAHTIHPHADGVYVVFSVGSTAVRRIATRPAR